MAQKSFHWIFLFIIFLLVTLAGAGCRSQSKINQQPEIVWQAKKQTAAADTLRYQIFSTISGEFPGRAEERLWKLKVVLKGDVNSRASDKADGTLEIKAELKDDSGESFFHLQARQAAGEAYARLLEAPENPLLPLSKIREQWYKFNREDLVDFSRLLFAGTGQKINTRANPVESLAIKEFDFFKFKENLGKENLGDREVYHYLVTFNSRVLADFVSNFWGKGDKINFLGREDGRTEEQKRLIGQVWIGQEDKYIYRLKIEQVPLSNPFSGEDLLLKVDIYFSDFNKRIKTKPPEQSRPLDMFFDDLWS